MSLWDKFKNRLKDECLGKTIPVAKIKAEYILKDILTEAKHKGFINIEIQYDTIKYGITDDVSNLVPANAYTKEMLEIVQHLTEV